MTAPQAVKKMHSCLIACVGATIGRPPTYRRNAFSGTVFLQSKRARASNARPYKRFLTVWTRNISGCRTLLSPTACGRSASFSTVCGPGMPGPYASVRFSLLTLFRCSPCPKLQGCLHNKRSPLWKKSKQARSAARPRRKASASATLPCANGCASMNPRVQTALHPGKSPATLPPRKAGRRGGVPRGRDLTV